MPTVEKVARTDAGLASELRTSVMRLRRRLANERDPGNDLSIPTMAVLGSLLRHGDMTIGAIPMPAETSDTARLRCVSNQAVVSAIIGAKNVLAARPTRMP